MAKNSSVNSNGYSVTAPKLERETGFEPATFSLGS